MSILNLKETRTSDLISKLVNINLVEAIGSSKYKFKK